MRNIAPGSRPSRNTRLKVQTEHSCHTRGIIPVEAWRNYDFFFRGILAPDLRASLSAMATACLRLVTFLPLPDFNVPSFFSFITL